jgi:hypothetical protein
MKKLFNWFQRKQGDKMKIKADSYKEAMEYVARLKGEGHTINEYTIIFNKEAVDLYEKPFQELIDNTFEMHYSLFEMDKTTDVWH